MVRSESYPMRTRCVAAGGRPFQGRLSPRRPERVALRRGRIAGKLLPKRDAMPQRIDHAMTTTAFALDGYRTTKTLGVVRGVTVRSRSVLGTIGAGLQT